jgi:hypothetical protein
VIGVREEGDGEDIVLSNILCVFKIPLTYRIPSCFRFVIQEGEEDDKERVAFIVRTYRCLATRPQLSNFYPLPPARKTFSQIEMSGIMSLFRKTLRKGAATIRRVGKATMKVEKKGERSVRRVGKATMNVEEKGEEFVRRVGKMSRKTIRKGTNTLGLTKRRKMTGRRRRHH